MNIVLKTIRENIGLTQKQVSELTGVPINTLRNWEQGVRKPSDWTIDLIVDKILATEINKNVELNEDGDDEKTVLTFSSIRSKVADIARNLDIDRIYLFGSYINGDATPLSDVDLYMESDIFGLEYFGVIESLRKSLHKKVDLLSNRTLITGSDIHNVILDTGVVIYER